MHHLLPLLACRAIMAPVTHTTWYPGATARGRVAFERQEAAPGSTCDAGGAVWSEVGAIALTCAAHQTKVTVPAKGQGELVFELPSRGALPARFTVAVRTDLAGLPDGCADLFASTAAQLYIVGELCASGQVALLTTSGAITPVFGPTQPGPPIHTLALSVDQSSARLVVDGKVVGRLTLPGSSTYKEVGVSVANLGAAPGSALLSTFSYSPTP